MNPEIPAPPEAERRTEKLPPDPPETPSVGRRDRKASEQEAFDLSKATDHPLVEKYQPRFLARGGEHIIYDVPGHPDIVAKVEAHTMYKIQKHNAERGLPLGAMDPEVFSYVQEHLKNGRERHRVLTEHFGREHVLGLKQDLLQVPVTGPMLAELHGGRAPAGADKTREAWSVVKVQKRAPEFADPERKTVVAGYAEHGDVDPDAYGRVTRALVEGDPSSRFDDKEFDAIVPNEFRDLLAAAERDPGLAASLKDLIERTARYAEKTGEILDLAGKDNVTVFKEKDGWNYRLVDALYPGSGEKLIERSAEAARRAAAGETLDEGEKNQLLNTINFTRAMNGMAKRLGVGTRISFVPEEAKGKIDFLSLLKREKKD